MFCHLKPEFVTKSCSIYGYKKRNNPQKAHSQSKFRSWLLFQNTQKLLVKYVHVCLIWMCSFSSKLTVFPVSFIYRHAYIYIYLSPNYLPTKNQLHCNNHYSLFIYNSSITSQYPLALVIFLEELNFREIYYSYL